MIKRTIVVSSGATRLSVSNRQLVIERQEEGNAAVPIEDVGLLTVDHPAVTYEILRASMARALVGSGLIATIGIHHHNRYMLTDG